MSKVSTKISPWEDVLIVVDPPEDVTDQGVVLSADTEEDKKRKPEKGIVVAIGPASAESKTIKKLLDNIKLGDLVFYERYTSNKIPDAGSEFNFVRFKYIMGYKKL